MNNGWSLWRVMIWLAVVNDVLCLRLHMMWTTPALTLQNRHFAVLKSYLHYHPDWTVDLYVSDDNWSYWRILLEPFLQRGYQLELTLLSEDFLRGLTTDECSVASDWVENQTNRVGRYYYSHLTDLLRFCLLIKYGGVYSDFDALLLRPLPISRWLPVPSQRRVAIGKDRVTENCSWCLPGGHYLAPGVMIAEPGAVLLKRALEIGFGENYDATVFNGAGPRSVTIASRSVPKTAVVILDREIFYPVDWKQSEALFKSKMALPLGDDPIRVLEYVKRRAYSIHFFGAQTKNLKIESDSIMDLVTRDFDGLELSGPEYFVTSGQEIVLEGIRWMGWEPLDWTISVDGGSISNDFCTGTTVMKVNECLCQLTYKPDAGAGRATLTIVADRLSKPYIFPIYNMRALLTVTIKTMDRMSKVFELISSLHKYYPTVPVIVANDGSEAYKIDKGPKRGFYYLPLPFDTGLSTSRNLMVKRVETALVMILDDDFVFTVDSDLGYLVHQLMQHHLDIVASTSPEDYQSNGFHYAGIIKVMNGQMEIIAGDRGALPPSTCRLVDIVPNIFVARAEVIRTVQWDNDLKLGEHEEFFMRAQQKQLRVATCDTVELLHRQERHWLKKTTYDKMRSRVWTFLQRALQKHELQSLVAFGMTTMKLQELHPEEITNIKVYDLQPFSVEFRWDTPVDYHLYSIDVYDATEDPDEILLFTHYVEPSKLSPTTPSRALITGLDPNRVYRLIVKPGNHTMIAETGPELWIQTPDYWTGNLLINGDIKSNLYWERSLGTQSGIVPLHLGESLLGDSVPARPGHHSSACQKYPLGDFAISLYVGATASASNIIHGSGVYQMIPAAELPAGSTFQISVNAWARVDRLFGPPASLSLELRLVYVWGDGTRQTFKEYYDPYEENRWQPLAFSTGLIIGASKVPLDRLEVWAWMSAPRGAVFFDDFYLAARPIGGDGGYLW